METHHAQQTCRAGRGALGGPAAHAGELSHKGAAAHQGAPWLCTQAAESPDRQLDPPGRRAAAAVRQRALLCGLGPRACPRGGALGRASRAAGAVGRRSGGAVPRPGQERVRKKLLEGDALERVAAQQPVQQRAAARRQRARHGRRQRGLGALDVAQQLHVVGAVEGRLACAPRAAAASGPMAVEGCTHLRARQPCKRVRCRQSAPPLCTSGQRRQRLSQPGRAAARPAAHGRVLGRLPQARTGLTRSSRRARTHGGAQTGRPG